MDRQIGHLSGQLGGALAFKPGVEDRNRDDVLEHMKRIEKDVERDYFLDAPAAAAYGLVDKVIDRRAIPGS